MLRSFVKTGAACTLSWTGADKAIRALSGSSRLPLVIGYHQVVERCPTPNRRLNPSMLISRRMLECHLDWIGRRFRFVSLDELGARLEEGRPFDVPVAAVTFDDGYRDVYDHAFPVLKRKGIPAAFFVVTNLVGTSRMQVYDRLHLLLSRAFPTWRSAPDALVWGLRGLGIELPETHKVNLTAWTPVKAMIVLLDILPQADLHRVLGALEAQTGMVDRAPEDLLPVSWGMLAEMHRAGMTIGSHTKTHTLLTNEPLHKIREEVLGSRQALERKLGITVEHFAYPYGRFNAAAVAAVAVTGYRFGYTTCPHRDPGYPLLTIPRMLLWENACLDALGRFSSAIMNCHVHRVFDLVTSCTLNHAGPRPPSWSWDEPVARYD